MRKSLVFLTSLLFALSAICADDGVNSISYGDELGSSELRIYFTPKVEDLVEISFSRNEVNDFFDEVIKIDGDGTEELLVTGNYATNAEDLYIYWKIKSVQNISASISIPYALKGSSGEIDWSVYLLDDSLTRISSDGDKNEASIIRPSRSASQVGSVALSINTETLNSGEVLPGEYTGELKLNIKTE